MVNLGIAAILYIILTGKFFFIVEALMRLTAAIDGLLVDVFSSDVLVADKLVIFGGFTVKIIEECTGIYEMLIFSAAVLAFPTTLKKKAIGIVLGLPLLYVFNLARILMLLVVGRYQYSLFEFMHLYFWQVTLILMIASAWLLWIMKVVKREEASPSSTA